MTKANKHQAPQIVARPIEALIPYARNARTHSAEQVAQIARSIQEFGWTNPILVDEAGGIIAGHGRLAAALELGLDRVPTICVAGLTETQVRAERSIFGTGENFKTKALETILELTEDAPRYEPPKIFASAAVDNIMNMVNA